MLSANSELRTDLDEVLSRFGLSATWQIQHKQPNSICSAVFAKVPENQAALIASALRHFPIWFELEARGRGEFSRYLFAPMLGLHRQDLDEFGEVLVRQGTIEEAVYRAKGNGKELERELRKLTGQNHMDLLQQFEIDELRVIPRAV